MSTSTVDELIAQLGRRNQVYLRGYENKWRRIRMASADDMITLLGRNKKSITKQKTVLIVDDDTGMLLLNNATLKNDGYAVTAATSGEEALETLRSTLVDVAVLDIQMPKMSGLDLYKKMLEDKNMNTIPVVFVTSASEKDTVLKAVEMGAAGYIVKPFDKISLLQKVRNALDETDVDQGVQFLSRKIQAILAALRHSKPLTVKLRNIVKNPDISAEEYGRCEQELRQNWERIDTLISEIPQEIFTPMFELMLKRLRPSLTARDIDSAMNVGNLIIDELEQPD